MGLNRTAKIAADGAKPDDALHGSSALLGKFLEVVAQFEQCERDLKAVRHHLEVRSADEGLGVRALAVMLDCAVMMERVIAFQIVALSEEAK